MSARAFGIADRKKRSNVEGIWKAEVRAGEQPGAGGAQPAQGVFKASSGGGEVDRACVVEASDGFGAAGVPENLTDEGQIEDQPLGDALRQGRLMMELTESLDVVGCNDQCV